MHLRDALPADLADIVAIYNASIPARLSTADTLAIPVGSRAGWFSEHRADRHPLWVVDDEGTGSDGGSGIAGWLSFQPFSSRPAYHATAELSIYIRPERQRAGIGRFLLGEAVRRAPSLGLLTLLGLVFAHNRASLALFEHLGFERWGRLPRVAELDGVDRDVVIVGRRCD